MLNQVGQRLTNFSGSSFRIVTLTQITLVYSIHTCNLQSIR
jgi:hypothetical protein